MPRGGKRDGAGRPPGSKNTDAAAARAALSELASGYVEGALAALAEIASSGQSEAARVSAACAILDSTYGRPAQAVAMSGNIQPPSEIRRIIIQRAELSDAALEEIVAAYDAAQAAER